MDAVGYILIKLLNIYFFIIVAYVVVSWLVAFGVINMSHPNARKITEVLRKLTEPVLKPVQKLIPPIAGIDLSPIVVIIVINILIEIIIPKIFFR